MSIFRIIWTWFMLGYSFSYIIDAATGRKLKYRTGECTKCGKCCTDCRYLSRGSGPVKLCTIYDHRPCNTSFPVSQEELDYFKYDPDFICGYQFRRPGQT